MIALQLFEKWDLSGFHEHTERIAKFYENQKTIMINAINKHLKGLLTLIVCSIISSLFRYGYIP